MKADVLTLLEASKIVFIVFTMPGVVVEREFIAPATGCVVVKPTLHFTLLHQLLYVIQTALF